MVRAGGNQRFYVNGVQDASAGVDTRADVKPLGIGNQTQYLTQRRARSVRGTARSTRRA